MRLTRLIATCLLGFPLIILLALPLATPAQTGSRVAFSVSPTVFPVGSLAHTALTVSCASISPSTISTGDTFTFFIDPSISLKTLIFSLPAVSSVNLQAADFSASAPSATQVVITYTGQPKPFSYGDTIDVEVVFLTGGQLGTGKVSFLSRFTGSVNGNLPYTTVSLVNFSTTDAPFIGHDATLVGGCCSVLLGVAVPLNLTGNFATVLSATSTTSGPGGAIFAKGGDDPSLMGGVGLQARGGLSGTDRGGDGLDASGGPSGSGTGGSGVSAEGGLGFAGSGGLGVFTIGGGADGAGNLGGDGIFANSGQGENGAANGRAGTFIGDVGVIGNLSKSSGSFKIDHPLDPANKYLYHSFVESPDMMNIYNGIARLDSNGQAVVELPEWFGALNRDFRYSLTALGAPGPNLYVSEEVTNNHFKIAGGAPGARVSWQVTGIRQDAWANAHRIPVEQDKSERERGHYLHPELYNQPEEKGVEWARHPELMRQMKENRERIKQEPQKNQ